MLFDVYVCVSLINLLTYLLFMNNMHLFESHIILPIIIMCV